MGQFHQLSMAMLNNQRVDFIEIHPQSMRCRINNHKTHVINLMMKNQSQNMAKCCVKTQSTTQLHEVLQKWWPNHQALHAVARQHVSIWALQRQFGSLFFCCAKNGAHSWISGDSSSQYGQYLVSSCRHSVIPYRIGLHKPYYICSVP